MRILVTGNMGYVGPLVLRRLRESHPEAELIGYDAGFFAHCLTASSRLPESRADVQYFGDVRHVSETLLRGIDAVVHLCAISNDPMGALFENVTLSINHRASVDIADRVSVKPAAETVVTGYPDDTLVRRALGLLDAPHG